MTPQGLELSPNFSDKTAYPSEGGAESGAVVFSGALPPDLLRVVKAWPRLSSDVREQILRLVAEEVYSS